MKTSYIATKKLVLNKEKITNMQRIAAAVATLGAVQALESYHRGHSPVKRSYDSVEYRGKNGKDFGFGETVGT